MYAKNYLRKMIFFKFTPYPGFFGVYFFPRKFFLKTRDIKSKKRQHRYSRTAKLVLFISFTTFYCFYGKRSVFLFQQILPLSPSLQSKWFSLRSCHLVLNFKKYLKKCTEIKTEGGLILQPPDKLID